MEVYIIRHGQSTNNAQGDDDVNRAYDPSLTDLGHQQAAALADYLAHAHTFDLKVRSDEVGRLSQSEKPGFGITRIYTSPMHRALQTALPLADALDITPEVIVDIHENGGVYLGNGNGSSVGYPGLTRAEMMAQFPGYILPERVSEHGWWIGDQEGYHQCQRRAQAFAEQLYAWAESDHHSERIAVVTHGTFIDCLLKALTGPFDANHFYHWHYNTAITRLDFPRPRFFLLRYVNRVDHLTPELVS